MAKAKSRSHSTRKHLVLGYLERISSKVFSDFSGQLTALVGKRHGVYALYKGDRLYYVGLAANLRSRVKQHLSDKHQGKWDKFSLYLVHEPNHLRELESLILRVSDPKGNTKSGRLRHADNLQSDLQARIQAAQAAQVAALFGGRRKTKRRGPAAKPSVPDADKRPPPLAPYMTKNWIALRATMKGKEFRARVLKNGKVKFKGVLYNSPTMAGKAAIGRTVNGWTLWRYKNADGQWVKLDELRKNK